MVAIRSNTSATPRRRSLAIYFDDAATRHALTPNTPAATAAPVENSTAAVFVATVNTLARDRFDASVAKHVIRQCFPEKRALFSGNEHGAAVLFAKLVSTIKEAFVNENSLFATLFDLEDVTTRVRAEANKLLFSTLELIYDPTSPATDWLEASVEASPHGGKRVLLETACMLLDAGTPFQGTSELLRSRFLAHIDPHTDIINFNPALASAKRKNTLDTEEIKGLFIDALDKVFYAAVVNRLTLTDQRAALDLNTIQLWARQCYASNVKAGVAGGLSAARSSPWTPR
ncbi:hypothetical protein CYMTET_44458 [Cymbomonas tetramitiformis]|uniref:Uncharacterized protein n=1 Tax=Cymbomonas tetramitiformis TaxID=36881 RepID=A0AAE0C1U5_9CHLO|nr:hypothetical protein CYMTET_44458 [Cymbomonas tetramitiformis]